MRGIPLTPEEVAHIKSRHAIKSGDKDEEYFTRSLNKLHLRGRDNFWQKNADRFSAEVSQCFGCLASDDKAAERKDIEAGEKVSFPINNGAAKASANAARPMGASRQMQGSSQYMVPSQTMPNDDEDGDTFSACGCVGFSDDSDEDGTNQGNDSYNDYLHLYQTSCKFADANKGRGRKILKDGMNKIKRLILRRPHEEELELSPGSLGITLRESHGHCVVALPNAPVTSNGLPSRLNPGDIILSLNGIELSAVHGGVDAWAQLFKAFSTGNRKVVIVRSSNASSGLGSFPKTSTKIVHKRKPKASSPGRSSRKRNKK
jgi:hypothetical protein